MSSNESKLLRAAFIPTFLTSGFAILISTLVRGLPGFLGAVLAQFVVIIFFIIHIAVSRMTRNLDPVSYTHLPSPRDRTRSRMPSSA